MNACFLGLLLVGSVTFSQGDSTSKPFTISGEIEGLEAGSVVLSYWKPGKSVRDTAAVKNGRFVFKGKLEEPINAEFSLLNDESSNTIYIEPGEMQLKAKASDLSNLMLKGSATQDDYISLKKIITPYRSRLLEISDVKRRLKQQIDSTAIEEEISRLKKEYHENDTEWDALSYKGDSARISFIATRPHSAYALNLLFYVNANEEIAKDSATALFNAFDPWLQQTSIGRIIAGDIRRKDNSYPGATAFKFSAPDINNNAFNLASLGGNVILLDFWASWCAPCRESTPFLKFLYANYHQQGFEIVSISQDDDHDAWKKAVAEDSMNWKHVSMPSMRQRTPDLKNEIIDNYFVQGIPAYLLIDRSGKIVGRWKGWGPVAKEGLGVAVQALFP